VTMLAVSLLWAGGAGAADTSNPGQAAYRRYCGACHGMDGEGDGVAATVMRPKPTNLTLLAKKHGGTFPMMTVIKIIDGRQRLAAHGESEMPVWGQVLREEKAQTTTGSAEVRGQVQLIAQYLASIQAK
jgi:mono/diheme cytochrome c family protein